jgi:hypothetical protein
MASRRRRRRIIEGKSEDLGDGYQRLQQQQQQ